MSAVTTIKTLCHKILVIPPIPTVKHKSSNTTSLRAIEKGQVNKRSDRKSRERFKTLYYIILKNDNNKNELKIVPWWASIQIYVSNITELVRVLRWIEVFYPSLQQHVPELVHAGLQGHQARSRAAFSSASIAASFSASASFISSFLSGRRGRV